MVWRTFSLELSTCSLSHFVGMPYQQADKARRGTAVKPVCSPLTTHYPRLHCAFTFRHSFASKKIPASYGLRRKRDWVGSLLPRCSKTPSVDKRIFCQATFEMRSITISPFSCTSTFSTVLRKNASSNVSMPSFSAMTSSSATSRKIGFVQPLPFLPL